MRKINDPLLIYPHGVRSDYNGPALIKTHESSDVLEDSPFHQFYKAAKPYSRWMGEQTQPYWTLDLPRDGGGTMIYSVPPTDEIMEAVYARAQTQLDKVIHEVISTPQYAINRALERSQAYGNLLMLVTATEAQQTVRMIRDVFVRLFRVVLDIYNKVKKLNVIGTIDVITDVWLEYRYGWRPLIGEIQGIHEALTVVRPKGIKSAYGTDKPETFLQKSVDVTDCYIIGESNETIFDVTFHNYREVTHKAGFNYTNKPLSRNTNWSAVFGIDINSLASTAWEMIPFSFVIDMFLNIGNMLQAKDVFDQVDSFNYYLTSRLQCDMDIKIREVKTKAAYVIPKFRDSWDLNPMLFDIMTNFWSADAMEHRNQFEAAKNNERWSNLGSSWNSDGDSLYVSYIKQAPDESVPKYASRQSIVDSMSQIPYYMPSSSDFRRVLFDLGYPQWQHMDIYYALQNWALSEKGRQAAADMVEDLWDIWTPERTQKYFEEAKALYDPNGDISVKYDTYYSLAISLLNDALPRRPYTEQWSTYHNIGIVTRKFIRGRCSDPKLLEQFNQTVKVSLLDRKLMPEFNHAFTADMNLDSGQYADLTAFAFKLGNYFRQLK